MADNTVRLCQWQLIYYYYKTWSDLEQFDLLLSKLREEILINYETATPLKYAIIELKRGTLLIKATSSDSLNRYHFSSLAPGKI
ncbi:hypothetical protein [Mucilaginibacter sp. FT3.2]|uniref:hypothetical protein n=1 Tax=Mucilaginibacter sp. FT3.2 TaxID=2723090 RepID=UPI0016145F7D|nr:hypothetical protein [Mucilaginibacter sp. FT3.2]MBB6233481.1 hypothetical protein [Mucilaginibacter sp. FT3.2]